MKGSIASFLLLGMLFAQAQAQTFSRTDTITYEDNLSKWVVGQQKSSTNVDTGRIESRTEYDPITALPLQTFGVGTAEVPGKLQQTLTYNADGTLATVSDGRDSVSFNTTITFSTWKRGIPQSIQYPDGTSESAQVNDQGLIDFVVDENGAKTCYAFDAMGRLTKITYPSETQTGICDTSAWNETVVGFVPVTTSEYGIGPGHWRRLVNTGNGIQTTYFDANWRPLVEERYDSANISGTLSQTVKRYDADGHLSFQSYPLRGLTDYTTVVQGARTTYDALGRVTRVEQDSELGVLATTMEYLSGFQTRTTNPRGHTTTVTRYRAYDQPSLDLPEAITHPEGAYTEIERNVFGHPRSLTRKNADGSLSVSRRNVRNIHLEVCKTIEPETGATVLHYDAAGNQDWSAAGLTLPSTTTCDDTDASIAARKVTRTFDARNRVSTLTFPDHNGDQTWQYWPDGQVKQIVTLNEGFQAINAYNYNARRQLNGQGESIQQEGWYTWGLGYGYTRNGHLSTQVYPGGETVTYAPNAMGQPTQVVSSYATYASGVSYAPNGAIQQFTYGNGLVHTLTQNTRQLPDRSQDAYGGVSVLDDSYDFDANANVAAISDGLVGNRGNRTMTYDQLDRLKTTASPMFGTGTSYDYDVLDNLTRVTTGGAAARDHYYCYDGNWRLTNVKTGSCGGASVIGLGYDVQGNLANKNGQVFGFDYGNRLRYAAGLESYRYDGHGRRILAWSPSGNILSMYGNDGVLRYQEDYRASKYRYYLYLAGSLVATREVPFGTATNTIKYQHTDALGSPVAVTDANRNVIERSEYEPYGKLLNRPIHDGPGYTSHVEDAATGLTYMQQRYYDPQIGRFLSVDPVTANGNTGANFNRYKYAANNPYRFIDPDGRLERLKSCNEDNSCMTNEQAKQVVASDGRKVVGAVAATAATGATAAIAVAVGAPAAIANTATRVGTVAEGALVKARDTVLTKTAEAGKAVAAKAGQAKDAIAAKANEIKVAVMTSPAAIKVMQQMDNVADAIDGYFNPGPPPMTPAGAAAGYAAGIADEIDD